MSKPLKWLSEAWDDLLVYLCTFLGIMLSLYIQPFKTGDEITLVGINRRMIIGAVIALMFVLKDEEMPKGVDSTIAKAGKRQNLKRRCGMAMTNGFTWSTMVS